jgi:hypothetical protein
MNTMLFIIGIWAGLCTFIGYCCVRVGSIHDDDSDSYGEEACSKDC